MGMDFTSSDCWEVKVLTPEIRVLRGGKCLLRCQTLHLLPVKGWGSGRTHPYQTLKVRPLWWPSAAKRCSWWTDTHKPRCFVHRQISVHIVRLQRDRGLKKKAYFGEKTRNHFSISFSPKQGPPFICPKNENHRLLLIQFYFSLLQTFYETPKSSQLAMLIGKRGK